MKAQIPIPDRQPVESEPSGLLYFWDERALYIGPGMPATLHAHHAIQVCIPLCGSIRLRAGPAAPWREYSGAVIPANQPHDSDVAVELLATFWLEPGITEARGLLPYQTSQPIIPLQGPQMAVLVPRFLACWSERLASGPASALLSDALRILSPSGPVDVRVDPRVARVAQIARRGHYRRRWLPDLAATVSLSPSRLEHLFKSEMGVPLRRYLLWQRLRRALRELAAGSSVTQAAHSAGFADTAHLSRTFRRMLGFTPSSSLQLQVSRFVQASSPPHG